LSSSAARLSATSEIGSDYCPMPSTQTLDGQAAVVTGGTRGIGRAIASHLCGLGATVAVVGRDADRGRAVVDELRGRAGRAIFLAADLADRAEAAGVVDRAVAELGRLDILVNNAAFVGRHSPLLAMPLDEWTEVVDTNLTATFLACQAAARRMVARGAGGAIVNILAIQSQLPIAGYGAYVASKGGLDALTRALAVELAAHRIRVNGVVVGSVYSASTRLVVGADGDEGDEGDAVPPALDASAATLVGRMGRPSEIARVVAFLASEDASYLTGSLLLADGGRLLNRAPDPLVPRQPRSASL
jgi:NAD(P)-dependent dehydrogenase (short-subunit alcohol dehydrogenase family)